MDKRPRRPTPHAIAALLTLVGALACLIGSKSPGAAQGSRTIQVWPDRSIGVAHRLWESPTGQAVTQVLPFGITRNPDGEAIQARTYLHFARNVLPPGSEIVRATLYVYVDSSSGSGETKVGAYRVLEPWDEGDWSDDPADWPALLASPIAVTTVRFGAGAPPVPGSPPATTAPPSPTGPAPTSTPSPTPPAPAGTPTTGATAPPPTTPSATAPPTIPPPPTRTPPTSPGPTPPTSPLALPSVPQRSASSRSPGLMALDSPLPTPPTPSPSRSSPPPALAPGVNLGPVTGRWLTWDVTALTRAWLAGEVPDDGLALAPAPEPDADPETAGALLVARQFTADDLDTRPHLIVELDVRPTTPTPPPALPSAGRRGGWVSVGLVVVGMIVLIAGLAAKHR